MLVGRRWELLDGVLGRMRSGDGNGQALHPLLGVPAILGLEHVRLVVCEHLECLGDGPGATAAHRLDAPDLTDVDRMDLLFVILPKERAR